MSQVCIPSIHKATNPARRLTKADRKKAERRDPEHQCDTVTRTTEYLHTIGRVGFPPMSPGSVKESIRQYHSDTGKLPTVIVTPRNVTNRSMTVWLPEFGTVNVKFECGDDWEVR